MTPSELSPFAVQDCGLTENPPLPVWPQAMVNDPVRSFFASQNRNPNMSHRAFAPVRFLLLLLTLHSIALASVWEINVNTAMTPAGKKLQHPAPGQPAYYYPYVVGYEEIGAVATGDKKLPDAVLVEHLMAEALASQGYLVTHITGTKLNPPPSLLLVFRWGNINPVQYDDYDDYGAKTHHHDQRAYRKEMNFVGLQETDLLDNRMSKKDLVESASDDRYYVTIAAYDFAAYYTLHKTALLWVSRMSIPKQDLYLDQVVAPLVNTGTPFLGRETTTPRLVDIAPPQGKVDVGTPVVKGYSAPGAAQPPAAPQP
jgi:hypothetical protein